MNRRYRCPLERIGAPPWPCRLALAFLGAATFAYATVISLATSTSIQAGAWFLAVMWLLVIVVRRLLYRAWRKSVIRTDPADDSSRPREPSSNWRLD